MRRRFFFFFSYDGSGYFGWQGQRKADQPTVEEALVKAMEAFFRQPITLLAASRTDRGVHALGQRAAFWADTTVPAEKIPLALYAYLPEDISVTEALEIGPEFHPRYQCTWKIYEYRIYNAPYRNPLNRKYAEFNHNKLDILKMQEAAEVLVGEHDFKAFCASGNTHKTTIRTIYDIEVLPREGHEIVIRVKGNGFLYNMVRIIAGTLMMVGEGKISKEALRQILESRDRTKAGKTAGPNGLTLVQIYYENLGKGC